MLSHNPWLRLSVVLFLALLARVACGASSGTASKGSVGSRRASSRPAAVNRETIDLSSRDSFPVEFWVGPGFAFYQHQTGFALNLGANAPLSNQWPIFVGIDAGINFWNRDYGTTIFANGPSENWTNI